MLTQQTQQNSCRTVPGTMPSSNLSLAAFIAPLMLSFPATLSSARSPILGGKKKGLKLESQGSHHYHYIKMLCTFPISTSKQINTYWMLRMHLEIYTILSASGKQCPRYSGINIMGLHNSAQLMNFTFTAPTEAFLN